MPDRGWPRRLFAASLLLAGCREAPKPTTSADTVWAMDSVWTRAGEELHGVGPVAIANGWIVARARNRGGPEVLAARTDDLSLRRVGRVGRGPGEYVSVGDIAARGDTVFVLDGVIGQLHKYIMGEAVRHDTSWTLPRGLGDPRRVFVADDSGFIIAFVRRPARSPDGVVVRETTTVARVPRAAGPQSVIGVFPGDESVITNRQLLTPAFRTGGYYQLTSRGVVAADGRTGAVDLYLPTGDRRQLVAPDTSDRRVTAQETARWFAQVEENARRGKRDPAADRLLAELALSVWKGGPSRPFYEGIISDGHTTALQLYELGDPDTLTWLVIDSAGATRGQWKVPRHLSLKHISGDTVIAISRDSLDIESFVTLRARRTQPPR